MPPKVFNAITNKQKITIDHVISHGKACSANGVIRARDGSSYVFNNVYLFSSHAKDAPIKEITSYIIEVDD